MTKNRTSDKWLPERVYRTAAGTYFYRPPHGKSVTLAPKDANRQEVLEAFDRLTCAADTTQALWHEYRASERFQSLRPNTKKDYELCWVQLKPVFGDVPVRNIKPIHIRKYMDMRPAKKRANTERILLKNILGYGYEYGWVESNACDAVKPYRMKPREKYVTDAEYTRMYDSAPPTLQVIMELCYICAARGQDIRALRLDDIKEDGLLVVQQKTGKKQLKLWNDRLRAAVEKAQGIRKEKLARTKHESMLLIVAQGGHAYTQDGLTTIFQKAKYEGQDWSLHDLKAKGISDFEGDKQEFSGHKSRLMVERYNRSPDRVSVIDFPKK